MLSKAKIKLIHSLGRKKQRIATNLFVAEGTKIVSELLPHFRCELLLATNEWLAENDALEAKEIFAVSESELRSASLMNAPQRVLAVFEQSTHTLSFEQINEQLTLVLDEVQDPGNLGTIVRIADWFGIRNVVCSPTCADIYNPKTTQATMGAVARVQVHYMDLGTFFGQLSKELPVYGTLLDGENMYEQSLSERGIIVMGSEGNGISPEIRKYVTQRLYIPHFPADAPTSESLNVAVATAIVCAEFRRRKK